MRRTGPAVAPSDWPLAGFAPWPGSSHLDGTALCPVPGPHGSQPAEPVSAPARIATWQDVRQIRPIHPDWTAADHLARLDGGGHDTDLLDGDPANVIDRRPVGHRRTARQSVVPGGTAEGRVFVVAGGDMVVAFDHPDAAGIMRTVLNVAGFDTTAAAMTPAQWNTVRAVLRTEHPHLVITDVRHRETR